MYRAKQRGRNRVEHFDEKLQSEFESRLLLGDDILTAIEEERFLLFYQPQYRCSDMKWIGVEALCRWQLESGEVLAPGRFLGLKKGRGYSCGITFRPRIACAMTDGLSLAAYTHEYHPFGGCKSY